MWSGRWCIGEEGFDTVEQAFERKNEINADVFYDGVFTDVEARDPFVRAMS